MRILNKYINHNKYEILEISVFEQDDIEIISSRYATYPHIEISLSSLQYLSLFTNVQTLILTGGVTTFEGLNALYLQNAISTLVLDFEETDSDEEGIEIFRFPNLRYVLSRSNLNICNYVFDGTKTVKIDILNFYGEKKAKVQYPPNYDLYKEDKFLFFSTEAKSPASTIIMGILSPVEKIFNTQNVQNAFSKNLDNIAIIPICLPQKMIEQGFGAERRLVSIKNRTADIRLRIPYEPFIAGDSEFQRNQCKNNILSAASYVRKKDKSFLVHEFISAIERSFDLT